MGIQRKDRKAIIERIFGPTGVTFEERSELLKEDCKVTAPKFRYLDNRLLPLSLQKNPYVHKKMARFNKTGQTIIEGPVTTSSNNSIIGNRNH